MTPEEQARLEKCEAAIAALITALDDEGISVDVTAEKAPAAAPAGE